jgi:hypothetical protein
MRQLYEHGLNRSTVDPSNPHDVPVSQMEQNAVVFKRAFDALSQWVGPLHCPQS